MVKHEYSELEITILLEDSISIRALDIYNDTLIGFGYNKGYGFINLETSKNRLQEFKITDNVKEKKNWVSEQRAVVFTDKAFFSLGVGSPARLRRIDLTTQEEKIVYTEMHDKVFYDAISFWNTKEGIAMGDPTDECLSILITRDGGETWDKIPCDNLPKAFEGEAAFAASNGNIAIVGDKTWIISGGMKSRVFYSPDKGKTWEVFDTPIVQGSQTTGGYSIHFHDSNHGIVFGGDYTKPEENNRNKAISKDGGKNWEVVADSTGPGYKSCVRYIPNTKGRGIVTLGFTGISISNDSGNSWKEMSKEGFYTLRFINDSIAIAAGKGRIARVTFK